MPRRAAGSYGYIHKPSTEIHGVGFDLIAATIKKKYQFHEAQNHSSGVITAVSQHIHTVGLSLACQL